MLPKVMWKKEPDLSDLPPKKSESFDENLGNGGCFSKSG